LTDREKIAE